MQESFTQSIVTAAISGNISPVTTEPTLLIILAVMVIVAFIVIKFAK